MERASAAHDKQSLISDGRNVLLRQYELVMDDPDIEEMEEGVSIEVFEPGRWLEREIKGDQMFLVLLATGAGFGLLVGVTVIMFFPLMAMGLIAIDMYTYQVYIAPEAYMILTLAEVCFFIPPIIYIRMKHLPLRSLGVKSENPARDILMGLAFGAAMLGSNLIITYFVVTATGAGGGDSNPFPASSITDVVVWTVVMFAIVAFSEEMIFRGFLQRRMEIYFGAKHERKRLYALLVTSFIFAAIHLDLLGLPTRFVLGLFLGFLAQRTKYSILGPTIAHGLNNSVVVLLGFLGF